MRLPTAIFETSVGTPVVDLYVLSGNAEIDVDFAPTLFNGLEPSQATILTADIVMAREALANLPRQTTMPTVIPSTPLG